MRAANIDGVGITSDVIRHDATFVQQNLEMAHGHLVICGIVKCEMTNLKNLRNKQMDMVGIFTLGVTPAQLRRYRIDFAMFTPVCIFLRRWKPINVALSCRRPLA
jgi:hypothetical protein